MCVDSVLGDVQGCNTRVQGQLKPDAYHLRAQAQTMMSRNLVRGQRTANDMPSASVHKDILNFKTFVLVHTMYTYHIHKPPHIHTSAPLCMCTPLPLVYISTTTSYVHFFGSVCYKFYSFKFGSFGLGRREKLCFYTHIINEITNKTVRFCNDDKY